MKNKEKEEQKIEEKAEKIAEKKIEQAEEKIEDIARQEKLTELEILKQTLEEKEKTEYINYGKAKILDRNIGIYDIFEQAMVSVRAGQDLKSIKIGLDMIYNEFSKMLKDEGVEKIDCLNKQFDPNICEALDQVEDDTVEEGIILAVYQNGYKLNGKLMRPARVKVAKKKAKEQPSSAEKDE